MLIKLPSSVSWSVHPPPQPGIPGEGTLEPVWAGPLMFCWSLTRSQSARVLTRCGALNCPSAPSKLFNEAG